MGYLSDVKLITTKTGWEQIKQAVHKVIDDPEVLPDYCLASEDRAVLVVSGKYVLAEWNFIKWYEGDDPEVDALMATIATFDGQGIPYDYMRTGEEPDDFDRQYGDANWADDYQDMPHLELVREITVEY